MTLTVPDLARYLRKVKSWNWMKRKKAKKTKTKKMKILPKKL
jgi:hypothetical protein